jgi:hypothetical protein
VTPSIDHLLTVPCELVRRTYGVDADAEGVQPVVETVVPGVLCELQTAGSREDSTGAVQITTYRVFLPAGTPLRGWDAVRLTDTGELLELEGDAFAPRSPLTGVSHVEAVAVRTDYGGPPPAPVLEGEAA